MINKTLVLFMMTLGFTSGAFATKTMPFNVFPKAKSTTAAAANVLYYGGPVIGHAQVYVVLWGDQVNPTVKAAMPDFYASVLSSDYMDWLKIYNTTGIAAQDGRTGTNQQVGRGAFLQTIQITPAVLSGKIDDLDIQAELQKQINAKVLPAPTADSLYMIHFPKGLSITMHDGSTVATSCQQFCAYHEGFKAADGSNVYYGVIPDLSSLACSMGCGSGGLMGRTTVSSSHELIEAITDPFPTPGTNPAYPQAWNTSGGEEIGDLCQSNTATLKGKTATYMVQQEFDNSTNACTTQATYTTN